jgi:hypothetical protein
MTTTVNVAWTNSLFIPAIDFTITKNGLKDYFETLLDSKVSRVDFVSFNSDKGTGRRAFIHFKNWNTSNKFAKEIRAKIESSGFYDINAPFNISAPTAHIYYRLMINKNPVPETEITMPQVASNMDFMAEKIRIQEEEIQNLKEEMAGMKQLMENMYYMMTQTNVYVTK